MTILQKTIATAAVLGIWVYTTTMINEYIFNRPMHSAIQLSVTLGILAYSFVCVNFIYKILTKNPK